MKHLAFVHSFILYFMMWYNKLKKFQTISKSRESFWKNMNVFPKRQMVTQNYAYGAVRILLLQYKLLHTKSL